MNEPTTEAGKRLLDDYPARYGGMLYTDPVSRELTIEAIKEIEAEARAGALEALSEALDALADEGYDLSVATPKAWAFWREFGDDR